MNDQDYIDDKGTFAYLRSDGLPQICDRRRWKRWLDGGGENEGRIKHDRVDDWEIETHFQGFSAEPDGPLLFWEVSAIHPAWSPFVKRFGTKEAALAIHAELVRRAMANELPQ